MIMNQSKDIYVTRPFVPPLKEYVLELEKIWSDRVFTNQGRCVRELEEKLKNLLLVNDIQLVSNGTLALQVSLEALDIMEGEIITTPFTYVATLSSIIWQRCIPVFVDIEPDTFTLDSSKIKKALTPNTKAILGVHVFGYPCQIDEIDKISREYSLKVIYDSAHAFGCKYRNKSLLQYGNISTVSFHATKLFHTAEGGAIITQEQKYSRKIDLIKRFGHYYDDYLCCGINAKLSELQAAMGLVNIKYINKIIEERKLISERYDNSLEGEGKIYHPRVPKDLEYNYAYYPVVFDSERTLLDVLGELNKERIYPRRYFYPSLNKIPYIKYVRCPVSEDISSRILCLPLFNGLSSNEQETIIAVINKAVKR